MGNFATMVIVLGGTFTVAGVLLYYSLLPHGSKSSTPRDKAAAAQTAAIAAAHDPVDSDPADRV
jgi:hypothetical protein